MIYFNRYVFLWILFCAFLGAASRDTTIAISNTIATVLVVGVSYLAQRLSEKLRENSK